MSKNFEQLLSIDVSAYIEKDYKKNSYISWATAYELMMEKDPEASYEIVTGDDGIPLISRGNIHFVKTIVTMYGESKSMFLPVMDNKHDAVANPTSRHVSDCIMRCLVKNIALFGIGLKLYQTDGLKDYIQTQEQNQQLNQIFMNVYRQNGEAFYKDCSQWIGRNDFKSFNDLNGLEADTVISSVKKKIDEMKNRQQAEKVQEKQQQAEKVIEILKPEPKPEPKPEVKQESKPEQTPTQEIKVETTKAPEPQNADGKIEEELVEKIKSISTEIAKIENDFFSKINGLLRDRYEQKKPQVRRLTQAQGIDFYNFLVEKKASL